MSESDSGDDGGIDKEALRKELREKYEKDEQERASAQRMSDLLLKGATMTSSHCGACGDPLFEQNGTTFCPSCHGGPDAVEGPDLESGSGQSASNRAPQPGGPEESTRESPSDRTAQQPAPDRQDSPGQEQQSDQQPTLGAAQPADEEADGLQAVDSSARDQRPTEPSIDADPEHTPEPPTASGTDAHQSVQRALERFAAEAATAEDPRYAKECLEAAREAAETLQLLR